MYNGKWVDSFCAEVVSDPKFRNLYGKVVLKTPCIDYFFTKEQWNEFKEKINEV